MLSVVKSYGRVGIEGYPMRVEVDVRDGLPMVDVVGLPDAAVRESRERVRAAGYNKVAPAGLHERLREPYRGGRAGTRGVHHPAFSPESERGNERLLERVEFRLGRDAPSELHGLPVFPPVLRLAGIQASVARGKYVPYPSGIRRQIRAGILNGGPRRANRHAYERIRIRFELCGAHALRRVKTLRLGANFRRERREVELRRGVYPVPALFQRGEHLALRAPERRNYPDSRHGGLPPHSARFKALGNFKLFAAPNARLHLREIPRLVHFVKSFPAIHKFLAQPLRGHLGGLEHHVRAVVFAPFARRYPVLRFEPPPVRRARVRGKYEKLRHRYPGARTYFENPVGDPLAVPVAPEPERREKAYAHRPQHVHKLPEPAEPRVVAAHYRD